jgi:hypothetical protein
MIALWNRVFGIAVLVAGVGLTACGGGGGGDGPDNDNSDPNDEQIVPGQPSKNTSAGITEACGLFPGASTQVNLSANASGAPLVSDGTSYLMVAAESGAGWSGNFSYTTGGGDVVFIVDTTAVTLDIPQGSAQPLAPTFIITSGGGAVAASESVAAPLACEQAKAAYRYELEAGTYTVTLNPTAWYQFRLVVSQVN